MRWPQALDHPEVLFRRGFAQTSVVSPHEQGCGRYSEILDQCCQSEYCLDCTPPDQGNSSYQPSNSHVLPRRETSRSMDNQAYIPNYGPVAEVNGSSSGTGF